MDKKFAVKIVKSFLQVTIVSFITLMAFLTFSPKTSTYAAVGRSRIRVYTVVDGQRVYMPGVTVLLISPMSNELWGTPYNYRSGSGIKHAYEVMNANGTAHFAPFDYNTADQCSGFGSQHLWGLQVYGGSIMGTIIGGVPNRIASTLGRPGEGECTRGVCGQGNWTPAPGEEDIYGCDEPWGYMNAVQCLTMYYVQNSGNNGTDQTSHGEQYRFLPYFPPGYRDAFLTNSDNAALRGLASSFDTGDLKGGGRFSARVVDIDDSGSAATGDRNDVTFNGVSSFFNYPNNQVVYLGRNTTGDRPESLYISETSNNAVINVDFEWFAQQPLCGNSNCDPGETCDEATQCAGQGEFTPGECRVPNSVDECTYCGDGIVQTGEQCDDGNTNNNDSCNNNCQQLTTTTTTVQGQPSYSAEKRAVIQCINNDTAARATYTITVRNTSNVAGEIESVSDTYDSRIQASWVSGISPTPASHSNHVITWNNNGNGYPLAAGQQLTFSYVVTIPSEYFGTDADPTIPYVYRNVAVIRPVDSNEIRVNEDVMINCVQTSIFDHAVTASILAFVLILSGLVAFRYQEALMPVYNKILLIWPISEIHERLTTTSMERFEKKLLKGRRKKSSR